MWQAIEYCCTQPVIRKSTVKVCTWRSRVPHGAFERLELLDGKLSRAVLRGRGDSNAALLPDCLGRALDWLTAHDLTALFAGLAHQARRRFGEQAEAVHVDSTSFAVEGAYEREELEANETLIRITYGYSRDHRADLKQWQLSLATTTSGVPIGLQLLDGNASDRVTLAQQVAEVVYQFRAEGETEPIYVADSALVPRGHDGRPK